ncbi:MAG: oxygen-independent coproporphyrinogen III oxidase [Nitrospirae bacterium]|nr:oxygen-independent coproporphyrinogen III oxidase [Nitrospirota bacterium]
MDPLKTPRVDPDLLAKYDRPGPRYTSYPTAPVWTEAFGPEAFSEEIRRTHGDLRGDRPSAPLSLYFHIPFCYSLCYYCGCNVVISRDRGKAKVYLDYLRKEVTRAAALMKDDRRVVQIHWGGGSPDFLSPDEMETLYRIITNHFTVAEDAEIGVELDPRETSREHLKTLRRLGFNRISMGVQDFDPKVQETVNRIQPEAMTRRMVEWCRELGFQSVNIDLIYGLPYQTLASFEQTVDAIIAINPDRMAVFNYAHVPWLKKHQKLLPESALPKGREKIEILKMLIEKFTGAGFVYVGMDHFARPQDELCTAQREKTLYRNFQGYTTKAGCDLFGFGVTAIGMVGGGYTQNQKTLREYYAALDAGRLPTHRGISLTDDDLLRRHIITRLMCDFSLNKQDVEERFGIAFDSHFKTEMEALLPLAEDGLCTLTPEGIEVTDAGRLLIRNIVMVFDAYLRQPDREMRFSRTV